MLLPAYNNLCERQIIHELRNLIRTMNIHVSSPIDLGLSDGCVTLPVTLLVTTIMSKLKAARDLSIPDLLRLLNEKLGLECTRLRETPLPPLASVASSESEVNTP